MAVPPAVKVPQFMELRGMVHALLEYTPKFADADTVPLEDKVADVVMAEKVVIDKDIPIMTNATAAVIIESFSFAVIIPSSNSLLDTLKLYIARIYFLIAHFCSGAGTKMTSSF